MTGSFDERRQGFESKWAHDADMLFKIQSRRDYLLGLWAAEKKGLTGADAEAFADRVMAADLKEPGDEDVFRMLRGELGAEVSDTMIRSKMSDLLETVAEQLTKDRK